MTNTWQLGLFLSFLLVSQAAAEEYDPLTTWDNVRSEVWEVKDEQRDRGIPIRIYLPETTHSAPVVIFSHGLGGSRDNNAYLGNHFAGRGYVVIFVQHPGSDESVWKNQRPMDVMKLMQQAANFENLKLRCEDVAKIVAQFKVWNTDRSHLLFGRLDETAIGMCGHSFGAHTTQAVMGQNFMMLGDKFRVPQISAGIAYSPSVPSAGDPRAAFANINKPMLLMTGTQDNSPIGNQTPESRRGVFPALPTSIDRYELVLAGGQHSAFSERQVKVRFGRNEAQNPNHHRVILGISAAFWDAYLKGDVKALTWLQGEGPRSIMEQADEWQSAPKSDVIP